MKTPNNFNVIRRNFGHWDIYSQGKRMFCIRGGPSAYWIRDERMNVGKILNVNYKTVQSCMSVICDELMFELIIAKGQELTEIQSWNI